MKISFNKSKNNKRKRLLFRSRCGQFCLDKLKTWRYKNKIGTTQKNNLGRQRVLCQSRRKIKIPTSYWKLQIVGRFHRYERGFGRTVGGFRHFVGGFWQISMTIPSVSLEDRGVRRKVINHRFLSCSQLTGRKWKTTSMKTEKSLLWSAKISRLFFTNLWLESEKKI